MTIIFLYKTFWSRAYYILPISSATVGAAVVVVVVVVTAITIIHSVVVNINPRDYYFFYRSIRFMDYITCFSLEASCGTSSITAGVRSAWIKNASHTWVTERKCRATRVSVTIRVAIYISTGIVAQGCGANNCTIAGSIETLAIVMRSTHPFCSLSDIKKFYIESIIR